MGKKETSDVKLEAKRLYFIKTRDFKESLEGGERVKCIVDYLKNLSRKDENEHKLADVNDGMESMIKVVWNELKYKADVKKEYGQMPLTKCNIGQLNQVFMNLLINAVHAIEEHGEILIKTEHRDGDIAVSVSDTGCGISEDKLNRKWAMLNWRYFIVKPRQ
jgi:two-component system NtrC family sensor kinase